MKNALSVCLVGKNRADTLERCLSSVAPFAGQIVFIDLGSTDRTVDIARQFGAVVQPFLWNNNWAHARNVALDVANQDWILMMEPDEALVKGGPLLNSVISQSLWDGFFLETVEPIQQEAWSERQKSMAFRLFRRAPDFRYEGAVREEIYDVIAGIKREKREPVKFQRLNDVQLAAMEPRPKRDASQAMYYLAHEVTQQPWRGRIRYEYGLALFESGRFAEALAEWQEATRFIDLEAPYFPCYLKLQTQAFYYRQRYTEALKSAEFGLTLYPQYSDLQYWAALSEKALGNYTAAANRLQQVLNMPKPGAWLAPMPGLCGFRTLYELGQIAEIFCCPDEASQYYALSLRDNRQYWPAMESLVRITQPHIKPAEAAETLAKMFRLTTPEAHLSLAQILLKLHAYEVALPYLEKGMEGSSSLELKLWHSLCMIQLRRFVKAQKLLEQVELSTELYPLAKLNALFLALVQKQKGRCRALSDRLLQMPLSADGETVLRLLRATALEEKLAEIAVGQEGTELLTELIARLLGLQEADLAAKLLAPVKQFDDSATPEYWGKLFFEFGAYEQAQTYFEQTLAQRESAPAHYFLAEIFWVKKDSAQALVHYERAYALEPNWPRYTLSLLERYQQRSQNLLEQHQDLWPNGLIDKLLTLKHYKNEPASQ